MDKNLSKTKKMFELLKYLKTHTDKYSPTSMPLIDYYFEKKEHPNYFGSKNTNRKVKHQIVKELADCLNTDLDGNLLPKEDWVIVYDGYGEPKTNKREFVCNLYYNNPFSNEELELILKSIYLNNNLSYDTKSHLEQKIQKNLYNKNRLSDDHIVRRLQSPIEKKRYFREKFDGVPPRQRFYF